MLVGNRVDVGLTQSAINALLPLHTKLKKQVNNVPMAVSPRATAMASSWLDNPTDKDRLLLKHQMRITA